MGPGGSRGGARNPPALGHRGLPPSPVPRLEHLNARAKLFVELPPEPLVLALVHVEEGSAGRGRTQAPAPDAQPKYLGFAFQRLSTAASSPVTRSFSP